jgi:hypothetical protein
MYAMHAAFRRDLDRLSLRAASPSPKTIDGWRLLRKELEYHHRAEDDDLWPMLRRKVTDPVIDTMVAEHAAIPPALDAVETAMATGGSAAEAVTMLRRLVVDHLDHEEHEVLPLVEKYLTAQEWHDWLMLERRKQPARARVEFLTWVLDDAAPADTEAVLRELPAPGRVVYRRLLAPRYRRRRLWSQPD